MAVSAAQLVHGAAAGAAAAAAAAGATPGRHAPAHSLLSVVPGCSKLWWLKAVGTLVCLIVGIG